MNRFFRALVTVGLSVGMSAPAFAQIYRIDFTSQWYEVGHDAEDEISYHYDQAQFEGDCYSAGGTVTSTQEWETRPLEVLDLEIVRGAPRREVRLTLHAMCTILDPNTTPLAPMTSPYQQPSQTSVAASPVPSNSPTQTSVAISAGSPVATASPTPSPTPSTFH